MWPARPAQREIRGSAGFDNVRRTTNEAPCRHRRRERNHPEVARPLCFRIGSQVVCRGWPVRFAASAAVVGKPSGGEWIARNRFIGQSGLDRQIVANAGIFHQTHCIIIQVAVAKPAGSGATAEYSLEAFDCRLQALSRPVHIAQIVEPGGASAVPTPQMRVDAAVVVMDGDGFQDLRACLGDRLGSAPGLLNLRIGTEKPVELHPCAGPFFQSISQILESRQRLVRAAPSLVTAIRLALVGLEIDHKQNGTSGMGQEASLRDSRNILARAAQSNMREEVCRMRNWSAPSLYEPGHEPSHDR